MHTFKWLKHKIVIFYDDDHKQWPTEWTLANDQNYLALGTSAGPVKEKSGKFPLSDKFP